MAGKDERSKLPEAARKSGDPVSASSSAEIAAFLEQAKQLTHPLAAGQRGRLLFALDATMSRQPTWDMACVLQAEMFTALPASAALDVQLLYFRGLSECRASKWTDNADELARMMTGLVCQGGHTQIGKVFAHARIEHSKRKLNAVVFVGDAMEEPVDDLAEKAGQLRLLGCPLFVFQEGREPTVEAAFREFARLSKGAYARFDASAPDQLKSLLRAVAAYATGGREQLKLQKTATAVALLEQLS